MVYVKWYESLNRFGFDLSNNGGHKIDNSVRDALLLDESKGKILAPDADGFPVAVDPPPPTDEQLAANERAWRDDAFTAVIGMRDRHRDQQEIGGDTTLSSDQFSELLAYMQLLRDWPQSADFPEINHRPVAPAWVAQQAK